MFPKFYYCFCKAVLRVTAVHGATEEAKLWATERSKPTGEDSACLPQGVLGLIPSLILRIHNLRYLRYPLVFFLCAVTWDLSECHLKPWNCSCVTCAMELKCSWWPACYILHGTVLFFLSYSSCTNFPALCFLFPSLSKGQQHFNTVTLACHWVYKVLQSAGCSSRNLFCSPLSSTTPKLDPAFECQRYEDPKAGR